MTDKLLTVREAAEYLGIKPGTLQNWVSARRIEHIKFGRLTRFSLRALEQLADAHTVPQENE